LLLDERTGVKLLGLDTVVEDPSNDPAFDTYKVCFRCSVLLFGGVSVFSLFGGGGVSVLCPSSWLLQYASLSPNLPPLPLLPFTHNQASIRRLLSLSTKLETLYLLIVPGGDPLQHRAAIRAISNAVLNCSRMVRCARFISYFMTHIEKFGTNGFNTHYCLLVYTHTHPLSLYLSIYLSLTRPPPPVHKPDILHTKHNRR
jgi:hypothetical protein